ncbi:poly-beta-1,6 N-acetyl-D-glucosamine export porin PgaA [Luteibacter yeojuensis]|uniref:Poly-beta-1,6 N-acetyl-D-glucosamine export porin PgaA n=1 Tax=Luteibacter yeojuensis TaxID=345309 RepID=A0A7X5QS64_9GAMM|nr:poly-beta-1,6 N-acetyl-D-glucosamine export porin PgaA [Luteibacter yeojuensis]NID14322.1 poly-beta-1,6 N-acetyl-D-glucosamine export porin PgaA [Luteibacter yeojuensis]
MKLNSTTCPRAARVSRARLCLALLLAVHGPLALAADHAAERDALMATARQERDAGHRVDALAHCQAVLERWPGDREAQALNVALLTELGASTRAGELAASLQPGLSMAERNRLGADRVAEEIRWADGEPADPFHPYVEADKSVEDARRVADDPQLPSDLRRRAGFDLLVALSRAGRPDEAVARYDALHAQGVSLPPYVERAAADALLAKRRPAEAAALYEDSIAKDPGPYDPSESEPRIGLMYAYLESGQTQKAFRTIDELASKETPWIRVPGSALPIQNPRKLDADLNAAAVRDYVDMHADAYARLEPLHREAPANAQLRSELGMTELARGWPRRALDDFDIALTLDPREAGAYVGKANASRVLDDYAPVDAYLAAARSLAERSPRVDRAQASWDRERGWQFDVEAERGKGSSPDFGDRDGSTQATIASPLIDNHWRVIALGRYSTADLPEGNVRRSRAGVGIRAYTRGLEAYVQALPSTDRYVGKTAIEAGFDWSLSDRWAWSADYSTAGDDTPLRAQFYGISAKTLDTTVTWRVSELTQARLGLSRDDFSDGNRRTGWLASIVRRMHTSPNLALDGGVELGGSMNTRTDRPYFNPRRDWSYALTGRLENVLGQFYERSVTQRIDAAVGQYAERGYATGWMASLRYGQIVQTGPGFHVGWGIGWHNQPYDGRREHRVVLDLTLHWGE